MFSLFKFYSLDNYNLVDYNKTIVNRGEGRNVVLICK